MTTLLDKNIIKDDDIVKSGGELIFNPYNELNKEITINDVQTILNNYGVVGTVDNIELYKRAFVHCSYTKRPALENQSENITIVDKPLNCLPLKSKSNERLEFLGDGVLECYTKFYLYRRFPKEDEGFMTEKKIALVKNEHIGKLARDMGLQKWYLISKHAEEKNIRNNTKKLGCLFEAFLGALFLDFNKIVIKDEDKWFENVFVTGPGFQMAQIFLENIFEKHVDWTELISNDDNYKNQLQVLLQKEFKKTPDYMIISQDLEEGYTMGVYLCLGQQIYDQDHNCAEPFSKYKNFKNITDKMEKDNKIFIFFEKGTHKIKKKAEQIACEKALNLILNKT